MPYTPQSKLTTKIPKVPAVGSAAAGALDTASDAVGMGRRAMRSLLSGDPVGVADTVTDTAGRLGSDVSGGAAQAAEEGDKALRARQAEDVREARGAGERTDITGVTKEDLDRLEASGVPDRAQRAEIRAVRQRVGAGDRAAAGAERETRRGVNSMDVTGFSDGDLTRMGDALRTRPEGYAGLRRNIRAEMDRRAADRVDKDYAGTEADAVRLNERIDDLQRTVDSRRADTYDEALLAAMKAKAREKGMRDLARRAGVSAAWADVDSIKDPSASDWENARRIREEVEKRGRDIDPAFRRYADEEIGRLEGSAMAAARNDAPGILGKLYGIGPATDPADLTDSQISRFMDDRKVLDAERKKGVLGPEGRARLDLMNTYLRDVRYENRIRQKQAETDRTYNGLMSGMGGEQAFDALSDEEQLDKLEEARWKSFQAKDPKMSQMASRMYTAKRREIDHNNKQSENARKAKWEKDGEGKFLWSVLGDRLGDRPAGKINAAALPDDLADLHRLNRNLASAPESMRAEIERKYKAKKAETAKATPSVFMGSIGIEKDPTYAKGIYRTKYSNTKTIGKIHDARAALMSEPDPDKKLLDELDRAELWMILDRATNLAGRRGILDDPKNIVNGRTWEDRYHDIYIKNPVFDKGAAIALANEMCGKLGLPLKKDLLQNDPAGKGKKDPDIPLGGKRLDPNHSLTSTGSPIDGIDYDLTGIWKEDPGETTSSDGTVVTDTVNSAGEGIFRGRYNGGPRLQGEGAPGSRYIPRAYSLGTFEEGEELVDRMEKEKYISGDQAADLRDRLLKGDLRSVDRVYQDNLRRLDPSKADRRDLQLFAEARLDISPGDPKAMEIMKALDGISDEDASKMAKSIETITKSGVTRRIREYKEVCGILGEKPDNKLINALVGARTAAERVPIYDKMRTQIEYRRKSPEYKAFLKEKRDVKTKEEEAKRLMDEAEGVDISEWLNIPAREANTNAVAGRKKNLAKKIGRDPSKKAALLVKNPDLWHPEEVKAREEEETEARLADARSLRDEINKLPDDVKAQMPILDKDIDEWTAEDMADAKKVIAEQSKTQVNPKPSYSPSEPSKTEEAPTPQPEAESPAEGTADAEEWKWDFKGTVPKEIKGATEAMDDIEEEFNVKNLRALITASDKLPTLRSKTEDEEKRKRIDELIGIMKDKIAEYKDTKEMDEIRKKQEHDAQRDREEEKLTASLNNLNFSDKGYVNRAILKNLFDQGAKFENLAGVNLSPQGDKGSKWVHNEDDILRVNPSLLTKENAERILDKMKVSRFDEKSMEEAVADAKDSDVLYYLINKLSNEEDKKRLEDWIERDRNGWDVGSILNDLRKKIDALSEDRAETPKKTGPPFKTVRARAYGSKRPAPKAKEFSEKTAPSSQSVMYTDAETALNDV